MLLCPGHPQRAVNQTLRNESPYTLEFLYWAEPAEPGVPRIRTAGDCSKGTEFDSSAQHGSGTRRHIVAEPLRHSGEYSRAYLAFSDLKVRPRFGHEPSKALDLYGKTSPKQAQTVSDTAFEILIAFERLIATHRQATSSSPSSTTSAIQHRAPPTALGTLSAGTT